MEVIDFLLLSVLVIIVTGTDCPNKRNPIPAQEEGEILS